MLKDQLINFLKRKNITFTSDDGFIIFDYAEKKLVVYFNEKDAYYFRLMSPGLSKVTDVNRNQYCEIINQINLNYKVGKLSIPNNQVWAFVEQFAYSEENIDVLFERCINVIVEIINEFNDEIKKISDTSMKEESLNKTQKSE